MITELKRDLGPEWAGRAKENEKKKGTPTEVGDESGSETGYFVCE
jgi:hypothetical protein